VPALKGMEGTRIVAAPGAIDAASWPEGALVWRLAPDEVLVTAAVDPHSIADPHAIVERETGYSAVWLERAAALDFLQRECDWELPRETPAFAQGIVAGLPAKIWFEAERVLLIVASPFAIDLEERLR
jgi:hypothetical protein